MAAIAFMLDRAFSPDRDIDAFAGDIDLKFFPLSSASASLRSFSINCLVEYDFSTSRSDFICSGLVKNQ
jgi:hypothetical protein